MNFQQKGLRLLVYTYFYIILAHYTGRLLDGTKFDSSVDRNEPFKFVLGNGQVIKGWDEGFATMKKGEKAILTCKSEYAYGKAGSPPNIPPDATLEFEVELIDFHPKKKEKWEMSDEEKKEEATKCKTEGNDLFKAGKYKEAVAIYKDGVSYVENSDENNDLFITLNLNIAMCDLKTNDYTEAIEKCSEVIKKDENNVKALYRRGCAYTSFGMFDEAKSDLIKAAKLDPKNKSIHDEYNKLKEKIKEQKQKEKSVFGGMFKKVSLYDDQEDIIEPHSDKNPKVFMNIQQGETDLGRIELELYENIAPKTVENFRCMITGEKGEDKETGHKLSYKGSSFHRIIKDFMIQGGDIINGDGTGSVSIYGNKFDDENFKLNFTEEGLLAMANSGPNTNGSQFFITTSKPSHLNGKHVVFGKVINGMDVVKKIENVEVNDSKPAVPVIISDCGEL